MCTMDLKNKKWFEIFDSGDFDHVYYVDRGHVYYDLICLSKEPSDELELKESTKFYTIPVPIFAQEKMGLKISGKEINLGKFERREIMFCLPSTTSIINRYEYNDMIIDGKNRWENIKLYNTLSEVDKHLVYLTSEKGIPIRGKSSIVGHGIHFYYKIPKHFDPDDFDYCPAPLAEVLEIAREHFAEEAKCCQERLDLFSFLSEREKETIKKVENEKLVIDYIYNQAGERVITDKVYGSVRDGFTRKKLSCKSAETLGLGNCMCILHERYHEETLSITDVLKLAAELA